jgi:hypothetical protein
MNAPIRRQARARDSAVAQWFEAQGWKPLAFQKQVWAAMREGRSGLLHATTGAGKTLAIGLGAWLALEEPQRAASDDAAPLTVVWITPMRRWRACILCSKIRRRAGRSACAPATPAPACAPPSAAGCRRFS